MLQQETISKIALLVSVAGIALLLALAEGLEARQVKIGSIDNKLIGWHVKVNARVASSYQRDGIAFMQLDDGTGKIKAVLFKPKEEQQPLIRKDSFASFEGKLQLYRDELEIVVERVQEWA